MKTRPSYAPYRRSTAAMPASRFTRFCIAASYAVLLATGLLASPAYAINERIFISGGCQFSASNLDEGGYTHQEAAEPCKDACTNEWTGNNGETRVCSIVGGSFRGPYDHPTYYEYWYDHTVQIDFSSGGTTSGDWISTYQRVCKPGFGFSNSLGNCVPVDCDDGEQWDAELESCQTNEEQDPTCPLVGEDVSPLTGNDHLQETDIAGRSASGSPGLPLTRYYNSSGAYGATSSLGRRWRHTYARRVRLVGLQPSGTPGEYLHSVSVRMPDGQGIRFDETAAGGWVSTLGKGYSLSGSYGSGWAFKDRRNRTETYNAGGYLTGVTHASGYTQSLFYAPVGSSETGGYRVDRVEDSLGNALTFAYNGAKQLTGVTDSASRTWTYHYDADGNLSAVDNPDGTTRQYHYNEQAHTANTDLPHALTGITDERGIRFATFEYQADGRAAAGFRAGNAQRVDIAYNDTDGSRTVTNSLGQASTYSTAVQLGVALVTGVDGPGCSTCGGSDTDYVYDPATNDRLTKTSNGITTRYGNYDAKGQVGCQVEGVTAADTSTGECAFDPAASPDARRTDYTYDPRFYNKRTSITEPSVNPAGQKVTSYTYDDYGNRLTETVSGFAPDGQGGFDPVSRSQSWQYGGDGTPECDAVPLHQLCRHDGPRTDVADVTVYAYYPDDPGEGNNRARLKQVTDATGTLVRANLQYNATGKVLSESRPNGVTLTYAYYPGNDRLQTLTEAGGGETRTTRWTYLATGEVASLTQADGTADATTLSFGYDDARRLTTITDGLGNTIEYTLDTEGNRLAEKTYDSTDTLKRQLDQTFDLYNRLNLSTETHDQRDYDYDPGGTLDQLTEGNGTVTDYSYDDLKRLTQVIQDPGGSDPTTADATSVYDYDAGDRLTQVTDPDGHATSYVYDDLGNRLTQASPDSGTTTFGYDAAGNRTTQIDARGVTVSYSYDALNRLTAIDYPGTDEDVVYTYDTGTNRQGRLNWFTDETGKTQYFYTALGDIKQVQRTIDGQLYRSHYSYDAAGRLKWNKFPGDRSLWRVRDAAGNLTRMTMTFDGQTVTVADNVTYAPFGPLTGLTYGNGLTETTDRALDYRPTGQTIPTVRDRDYAYDTAGNLTGLTDLLDTSLTRGFGYDALSRLTGETGPHLQTLEYDLNGNRTQQVTGWTTNYQYDANSNRLTQVGSQAAQTFDAMGNTLTAHDNRHGYRYNQAARLAEFRKDGVLRGKYTYNALGQRVIGNLYNSSGAQTATILYFYDLDGTLESELRFSAAGQLQHETDYVNLDDKPLAWTRAYYNAQGNIWKKEVYYLHTDHLNTPRLATNDQRTVVWRWDGDGFGDTPADTDPDGDGTNVNINLRFPGQYYDQETGLHYNYFRYYDPATGRYLTSDPIGLAGSLNTYAYVDGNPINFFDTLGLFPTCESIILGTFNVVTSRTEEQVLRRNYGFAFVVTGPSVSPSPDPRRPRRPPISPSVRTEVWWALRELLSIKEFEKTKTFQNLKFFCTELLTDECGNTSEFNTSFERTELINEIERLTGERIETREQLLRLLFVL